MTGTRAMTQDLRLAVVGAGGFARFAVDQFLQRSAVTLVAVCDPDPAAVDSLRGLAPGLLAFERLETLLAQAPVDLVYIASPPWLHHAQSLTALQAGKHVICEKPAALNAAQARELVAAAEQRGLLYVVNLMQRYNPLFGAVRSLLQQQLLGECLHGFFENYASDEFLPAGHWFWDEAQSGGLFIEHGVHFFDLFSGWLGTGRVLAAQKFSRPGHPGIHDQAQCDVLHAGQVPVRHYHGFNQPKLLDRQELRLQFERGEITLHEWVPTRLALNAVCSSAELQALQALFPQAEISRSEVPAAQQRSSGRFKPVWAQHRVHLDTGRAHNKTEVYQALLRRMFDDQLSWLADRRHVRTVDAGNAVESLAMAEQAAHLALARVAA